MRLNGDILTVMEETGCTVNLKGQIDFCPECRPTIHIFMFPCILVHDEHYLAEISKSYSCNVFKTVPWWYVHELIGKWELATNSVLCFLL